MFIEALQQVNREEKTEETRTNENDSDVLFCQSLINRLKGLPLRKNRLAHLKIEEVLFNLEFEEECLFCY